MPRACESHYGSRRRRESTARSEPPEVKRGPKSSGIETKSPKVVQRPVDEGPPLTVREIQLAPVIWAKLAGYSWWPARAATPEEVKGVKRPHGKDMICTYFLGDNNIGFVKLTNVLRFTHENCEQYGSRIATKSFKDGVTAAMALLRESDRWEREREIKELEARAQEAANGVTADVTGQDVEKPIDVDGTGVIPSSDDGACEMCGDNNEAKGDILLCDSCDAEYHLACCTPPLKACPEGEWFCLTCRANRGEPVSVLFNEERAKKEATAKQHEWLGKPPLPNKAGKKRSATDTPSPKKSLHKKVKPNGSAAGAPAPDTSIDVTGGCSGSIGEKIGVTSPVLNRSAMGAATTPTPSAGPAASVSLDAGANTNSNHAGPASPSPTYSSPAPRGIPDASPASSVQANPGTAERQQRASGVQDVTIVGVLGAGVSGGSNSAPRRGRPPGTGNAHSASRVGSRGGRIGRPPSKSTTRVGRPPSKPSAVVGSAASATAAAAVYRNHGGVGDPAGGSSGSRNVRGGTSGGNSTGGGAGGRPHGHHNDHHPHQQSQQQILVRGKRPRGEDGAAAGGRGWGASGSGSSNSHSRTGRAPPPAPAPYANASHAFARLGIPVGLPGGGGSVVQQQLHLQQTVQQLQATQHFHAQRGTHGGSSGGAGGASSSSGGRRSPCPVSDPAEMPICFMCQEDVMQWGENAGNGEALRCVHEGCARVFHVTCVAHILQDVAIHTPGGSGALSGNWTCPLHRCARCGTDGGAQDHGTGTLGSGGSGGRGSSGGGSGGGIQHGSRLWQCTWCSVAFCMKHLPSQLSTAGRKARVADANQCPHCRSPSPRVKLAQLLERMCSRLANHHLAIPFLRPFLPGIASSKQNASSDEEVHHRTENEGEQMHVKTEPAGASECVGDGDVGGDKGSAYPSTGENTAEEVSPLAVNDPAASGKIAVGVEGESNGASATSGDADNGRGGGGSGGRSGEMKDVVTKDNGGVRSGVAPDSVGKSATINGSSLPTMKSSHSEAPTTMSAVDAVLHTGGGNGAVESRTSAVSASPATGRHANVRRRRRAKTSGAGTPKAGDAVAHAKRNSRWETSILQHEVEDIMGLLDKTRALGYSRGAELIADVRMLQGKCRQAVARWGGDPETGGGFGAGAGRVVVNAMDTLAANMESMLARSREELANVEADVAKKSEDEHRRLTDRGVGDGTAGDNFPWRAECLPPPLRSTTTLANGSLSGSSEPEARTAAVAVESDCPARPPPLRLTRRWSLSKWAEYLQNPPMLRRSTGQMEPGEVITIGGKELLGTHRMREEVAEGMRSPAFPANPDDSEVSDGCYMSDFYSDDDLEDVAEGVDGGSAAGPAVPPWSELETAVQALMGMEGIDGREDGWDATESVRLVQMESVLEEQRRLMRRMIKHNGNLRALWRRYAASPLEDRGGQGSEGVVTLGETSVLKEFQISNDILRKRVRDLEEQLKHESERTEGAQPHASAPAPAPAPASTPTPSFASTAVPASASASASASAPASKPALSNDNSSSASTVAHSVNVSAPVCSSALANTAYAMVPGSGVGNMSHGRENGVIVANAQTATLAQQLAPHPPIPTSNYSVASAIAAASAAAAAQAPISVSVSPPVNSGSADEREEGPPVDVVGFSQDFTAEPTVLSSAVATLLPVLTSASQVPLPKLVSAEVVAHGQGGGGVKHLVDAPRRVYAAKNAVKNMANSRPIGGNIGVAENVLGGGVTEDTHDDGDDGEVVSADASGSLEIEDAGAGDNDDDDAGVLL